MNNTDDIIIITAARPWQWVREKFNVGRGLTEKWVEGYKEKMEALRAMDDKIYEWSKEFYSLIKEVKKAFKAGRIVDLSVLLVQLNNKLKGVEEISKEFEKEYRNLILELEGESELLSPANKELKEFHERLTKKNEALLTLIAQGGVLSDWARRRVLKRIESKKRRERDSALRSLISNAERIANSIKTYLSNMSSARVGGNIGEYMDNIEKISRKQSEFEDRFIPIYREYLQPTVELALERIQTKEQEAVTKKKYPYTEEVAEVMPKTIPGAPANVDLAPPPWKQEEMAAEQVVHEIQSDPEENIEQPLQMSSEWPSRNIIHPSDLASIFPEKSSDIVSERHIEMLPESARPYSYGDPTKNIEPSWDIPRTPQVEQMPVYRGRPKKTRFEPDLREYPPHTGEQHEPSWTAPKTEQVEPSHPASGGQQFAPPVVDLSSEQEIVQIPYPLRKYREEEAARTEKSPETLRSSEIERKKSYIQFLSNLNKFAELNDKNSMITTILKYSEMVDEYDNNMSLKLIALAEGLINEK